MSASLSHGGAPGGGLALFSARHGDRGEDGQRRLALAIPRRHVVPRSLISRRSLSLGKSSDYSGNCPATSLLMLTGRSAPCWCEVTVLSGIVLLNISVGVFKATPSRLRGLKDDSRSWSNKSRSVFRPLSPTKPEGANLISISSLFLF